MRISRKRAALFGHGVGPVLAHAHPVSIAGDGKGEACPIPGHGEGGGAQENRVRTWLPVRVTPPPPGCWTPLRRWRRGAPNQPEGSPDRFGPGVGGQHPAADLFRREDPPGCGSWGPRPLRAGTRFSDSPPGCPTPPPRPLSVGGGGERTPPGWARPGKRMPRPSVPATAWLILAE